MVTDKYLTTIMTDLNRVCHFHLRGLCMKPLGRRYYKCKTGSKHSLRINGKYHCWWGDVVEPSKRYEQRLVDEDIKIGEQLYYDYIEDTLDDASGGSENR